MPPCFIMDTHQIPTCPSKAGGPKVWGQLQLHHPALNSSTSHIDLTDRTFTVGRLPECNFTTNEHNVRNKGILKHISRKHFVLRKQMVSGLLIVHVTDLSFNGTFVNGALIGRNHTFTLFDGDSLAIGKPDFTIFTFKDLCTGSGKNDSKTNESEFSPEMLDLEAELTANSSLLRICNVPLENDNLDSSRPASR